MSEGKHMCGISNKCQWIIDTGFRLKSCGKPKPCSLHESQPESAPLKPFIDRLKKLKTGSTLTSGDVSALIAIEEYFSRSPKPGMTIEEIEEMIFPYLSKDWLPQIKDVASTLKTAMLEAGKEKK